MIAVGCPALSPNGTVCVNARDCTQDFLRVLGARFTAAAASLSAFVSCLPLMAGAAPAEVRALHRKQHVLVAQVLPLLACQRVAHTCLCTLQMFHAGIVCRCMRGAGAAAVLCTHQQPASCRQGVAAGQS